ncbi:MAG: YfhO family protein [Acidobacteria bacterium]|nr:YfhO family protein [Acidobacteriota bacterium]
MHITRFPVVATGTVVLALLVVFFPSLFFGRVISPLDALYNTPPWRATHRPVEVTNPDLTPAAMVSLSLMEAARHDGRAIALWNPYLSGGASGTLAWNNGLLSPAVLPFWSWIDPARLPNAMVLVKFLLAFVGLWLFLKRFGLGDVPASVGGVAYALAGPLTANWLWPSSATAAGLPLLLWAIDKTLASARPWRWIAPGVLAWLVFLTGGAFGTTLVGGVIVAAWTAFRWLHVRKERPGWTRPAIALAVGPLLAVAVLAPSVGLFAASLHSSGVPKSPVARSSWGAGAVRLLGDPFVYGDPRKETFTPPSRMGTVPFHDTVLSVGTVTLFLAILGAATRKREAVFWTVVFGFGLLMVAWGPAGGLLDVIPGGRGIPAFRMAPYIALAAAVLAAWGVAALQRLAGSGVLGSACGLLIVAVALEQGMFAGHLLAFLPPSQARWPVTRGLEFLEKNAVDEPSRVAPLGDTLTPDTAQAYGLEDLRSRSASTRSYRRLLSIIDPQVEIEPEKGLRLNAATVNLQHPYLRALGARWVLEDPRYGLVEFSLGQNTVEIEPRHGLVGPLVAGSVVTQDLFLPRGCSRFALNGDTRREKTVGTLRVTLTDEMTGLHQAAWTVAASKIATDGFVWLNMPPGLDMAHRFRLTVVSEIASGTLWLRRTSKPHALDGELLWNGRKIRGDLGLSFDVSGYVPVYTGRDLRIWEDRRAAPRFWMVRRAVPGGLNKLLDAQPPFDLMQEAVVSPRSFQRLKQLLKRHVRHGREELLLKAWAPALYELRSTLATPALMVSSLPSRPALWRAYIDGHRIRLMTVNGLFIGLPVPAGTHRVRLEAGLPVDLWAASGIGMLLWMGLAIGAVWAGRGRRR